LNIEVKGLVRDEETEALENSLPVATEENVE